MADATKETGTSVDVGVEHIVERCRSQVGGGDDAGDRRPVRIPVEQVGGRCDDEPGFADRGHRIGVSVRVAGAALDEHGLHDVVARAVVGHEFVDAVGERQSWRPEVVVWVDDRAGRIDRLFRGGVEPVRGHRNRHGGHGRTPTGDAPRKPDVSHITHVRPPSPRKAPIGYLYE